MVESSFQVDRLPTPREYETFRLEPDNLIVLVDHNGIHGRTRSDETLALPDSAEWAFGKALELDPVRAQDVGHFALWIVELSDAPVQQ